jgi:peptidylprolyl isomerase/FKBP-type peptidyl-prolyl cis-trans isomerase SlpA
VAKIKQGDTVSVHYTGRLEDGTVFDSSREREPLTFEVGAGQVIEGFENAVVGMETGESQTEEIPSEQAYGDRNPKMVVEVDKEQVGGGDPEVGQQLQVHLQGGQTIPAIITDVGDSTVTIDANHPLAGKTLVFDIEVVDVNS